MPEPASASRISGIGRATSTRTNAWRRRSTPWKSPEGRRDGGMFGLDITIVAIIALAALSTGGLCYGLLFARIETEKKTETRVRRVKAAETDQSKAKAARDRMQEISKRRKSVQDSLKELEKKQREQTKRIPTSIKARLAQ